MRKGSILLVCGGLVAVLSLMLGPSATATTERASAGTVTIVHDQEPGILNNYLSEGNGYTVSLVMNTILAGGLIYNDKVQLKPYLFEALPKLTQEGAAHDDLQVQEDGQVERRSPGHRCRLHGHVPDDHEPGLGHHVP